MDILLFSRNRGHPGFIFIFIFTSRHQRRHQRLATTASGHQRQQRQGQCRPASGWTAQRERAAEGATRAVGARRGSRRHCWRRVDNMTRASDEQRTAGGCSDDGGGNVVARTAGGGQCHKTRRIRRTMRQHQTETADDGTSAGGDEDTYGYGGRCDNIRRRLWTMGRARVVTKQLLLLFIPVIRRLPLLQSCCYKKGFFHSDRKNLSQ